MLNTKIYRNGEEVSVFKLRAVVKRAARRSEFEGLRWDEFAGRTIALRDAFDSLGGGEEASGLVEDAPDGQNWIVVYRPARGEAEN